MTKPTKTPVDAAKDATKSMSGIDMKELGALAKWLESTGLEEVEVETMAYRFRLKKPSVAMREIAAASAAQPHTVVVNTAPMAAGPVVEEAADAFKSPMVGTFYHASSPDAAPYVKVGDTVTIGQTLGIIEAMKTMNQIEADRAGTVRKIMVANAQPVEYGQPLFIIA